jgi:hypothetical protein
MQGEDVKAPWIEDWHCVHDLKTGEFSVPPDFAEHNAKAVTSPEPKNPEPKNLEPKNAGPK